ncbi:hypothetical protein M3J09_009038 [Ascochyta lentis]
MCARGERRLGWCRWESERGNVHERKSSDAATLGRQEVSLREGNVNTRQWLDFIITFTHTPLLQALSIVGRGIAKNECVMTPRANVGQSCTSHCGWMIGNVNR